MGRTCSLLVLRTLHAWLLISVGAADVAEAQGRSDQPRFRPGVPILSQVGPEERVVEALKDAPPDVGITPDAEEEIEALTRMSDAVAIVRVVDKRSAFTTQDLPPYRVPGDWIDTTVAARVLTVLKDPDARLPESESVSFSEDGGELAVDGRRVIARNAYELPTRVGQTYLMFFWLNEDALQSFGPSWTFHVDGQKLHRLRADIHPEWELERKTLEWAKSRVRAKAHLPKRKGVQDCYAECGVRNGYPGATARARVAPVGPVCRP